MSKNMRRISRRLTAGERQGLERGHLMSFDDQVGDADLIQSNVLTVDSLNENLRTRYARDIIYTLCGTILVAVNPYKRGLPIYSVDIMRQYKGQPIGTLPPHVFAVADQSFRDMIDEQRSVSIIISGESGAGKTETTKLILNYVSSLHNQQTVVEARLIESASLLEAFGNAKTVRNNNSSRFGKLIKILFSTGNRIAGAEIETYLLERSRVSHRDENERNYHIFYQLTEGATPEDRERYSLSPDGAMAYKFTEGCIRIPGQDETEELVQLRDGLSLFNFDEQEVDFIFSVVAAILHMGNVTFGYDSARQMATLDTKDELLIASDLLKLPAKDLEKVLVERTIFVRGQKIRKGLLAEEAAATRDALCRTLYAGMFDWIVAKLNGSLVPETDVVSMSLGVLDIFGFENFKVNSFEQLCINYTNEKLHALFIEQVFTLEQKEYVSEGLKWTKIDSSDNQECINLIEGKMGILTLLDEESKLQSGTDASFLKKMASTFTGQNKCYKPARLDPKAFVVSHFAEPVTYQSEGFREKNQNTLADDVNAVIAKSSHELVRLIMSGPADAAAAAPSNTPPGRKASTTRGINTIGSNFRRQLIALKRTLDATKPFFIRCIKLNAQQKPDIFEDEMVKSQLAYSGMVETVKIRSQGFPYRIEYEPLQQKYKPLGMHDATAKGTEAALKKLKLKKETYAVGKTKLFLKSEAHQELERRLILALRKWAVMIQAAVRMFVLRRRYQRMQEASSIIGANMRIVIENNRLQRCVVAALKVAEACEESRREEAATVIALNWLAVRENRRLRMCVAAALACANACEAQREIEREAERQRLLEEARRRKEELKRRQALEQEERERLEREDAAAAEAEKQRRKEAKALKLQRQRELMEQEEEEERAAAAAAAEEAAAAKKAAAAAETSALESSGSIISSSPPSKHSPTPPKKPRKLSSPRRAAPVPPGKKAAPSPPPSPRRMPPRAGSQASMTDSQLSMIDDETQALLDEIAAMEAPEVPEQSLMSAKSLQRRVKGQPPVVADAMYQKTVELYRHGLEKLDDCDAYINCGTALINQANLRSVMPSYHSKSQACIPLLDLAMRMLERALSLGLDAEGKQAIQLRLRKCEELKEQALDDDAAHLAPEDLEKIVKGIQRKLDMLKTAEHTGKVKMEATGGLMGLKRKTVWKDFVLVLAPTRVQWYLKDTTKSSNLKGEVTLAELTAVKETVLENQPNCFALVGGSGFYPFKCNTRNEMEEWVRCISTNMQRLKLLNQIAKLSTRK